MKNDNCLREKLFSLIISHTLTVMVNNYVYCLITKNSYLKDDIPLIPNNVTQYDTIQNACS
jgi:hypothetical protein